MEGLAGIHFLVLELISGLERGESVPRILRQCHHQLEIDLVVAMNQLVSKFEQSGPQGLVLPKGKSIYWDAVFQLIVAGLRGEPVLKKLTETEKEIHQACADNVEEFIQGLPIKVMLPVLLLQFPAFLILVIGPMLAQFLEELAK